MARTGAKELGYAVILGIIFHAAHFAGVKLDPKSYDMVIVKDFPEEIVHEVWVGTIMTPCILKCRVDMAMTSMIYIYIHIYIYIDCRARQSVSVSYIFRSGNCKREAAAFLSVQVLSHLIT